MYIHILGAGWVGLVTAAVFADRGHVVHVVECNSLRVAQLRRGALPFFEPGLQELLDEGVREERIAFFESHETISVPDGVFCCVGTPGLADGSADLTAVFTAVERHASLFPTAPFVIKSTVPPGTCRVLAQRFPQLFFAANPEFLSEGTAVRDACFPSRIVFGTEHAHVLQTLREVYAPWQEYATPLVATTSVTAELAKYAANAFLATKISFINEMSEFAEEVGADMHAVAQSMGYDARIGQAFLGYGLGYGGSCFPKDIQALLAAAQERQIPLPLVQETERRNIRQRERFLEKVIRAYDECGKKGYVAVLGMAYKPETDDIRFSPAVFLLKALLEKNIPVQWFDPRVQETVCGLPRAASCASVCEDASVVFVATAWPEIMEFARTLPQERVIWGRNA